MSTIDHFKYRALLSELEAKRVSKKPVTGFISKVFKLSNELSSIQDFRETTRYAFMLITRAISYSTATRKCTAAIQNRLKNIHSNITQWKEVTPDNILETFEFLDSQIEFVPRSLEELPRLEELLQKLEGPKSYYIRFYYIKDSDVLDFGSISMTRFYLLGALGEDSLVLKCLNESNQYHVEIAKLIPALEAQIERLQIILKEAHEHHSRSLTTN